MRLPQIHRIRRFDAQPAACRPKPLSKLPAACVAVFAAIACSASPAFAEGDVDSDAPAATLLGDVGGLRPALARFGVTVGLSEISEWLQNARGGIKTGNRYHGLTTLTLGVDTAQAGMWQGGSFNVSALEIHGHQLSPKYIGSLQTASGIEAIGGPRLWELWYEQKLRDGADEAPYQGLSVRVGQQSLDQEFMVSEYAATFVGTAFGWPALPSADLPAGGPAYPLSGLGVRVRLALADSTRLLFGAFAGDPANTRTQDPQKANDHGTTFSLNGGTLYIAELQHSLPVGETGKAGTYKIGAWYHNQHFADTRFDTAGLSLADPSSNGSARQHAGNWSVYAVADQTVWQEGRNGSRALNLFARAMGAPGDRNLISFSANLGLTLNAPFAGRENDVFGVAVAYAKVGSHSRALDADTNAFAASRLPVRRDETFIEATYQFQITSWWQLQGVLQHTVRPGVGVVDPGDATNTRRIPNSTVLGLRTTITF
jgi:porin